MKKFADSFASILGIVAACLLSIATASTCSVALAQSPPAPINAAVCVIDTKDYNCPYFNNGCVNPTPTCYYTDLTYSACECRTGTFP